MKAFISGHQCPPTLQSSNLSDQIGEQQDNKAGRQQPNH